MADAKISQLPETIAPLGVDVIPIVTAGDTKKVTVNNILALGYQGSDVKALTGRYEDVCTKVESTSADWNKSYNISLAYSAVSSTFLTSETDSQTLSFDSSDPQNLTISNGNTISLSALASKNFVNQNFLPLSGGEIVGDLIVADNLYVNGSAVYINASDLVVSDPIIYIGEDNIADTLDLGFIVSWTDPVSGYTHGGFLRRHDNKVWTLFKGASAEPLSGLNVEWDQVGLQLDTLSADFAGNLVKDTLVFGSLSASGLILGSNLSASGYVAGANLNTINWDSVYTTVLNTSGNWDSVYTTVLNTSGNWEDTYTTFKNVSSTFLTSETDSQTLNFDEGTKDLSISNGNTVSLSALINVAVTDTEVRALTANWEDTYTTFKNVSSTFLTSETDSQTLSFDDLTKDLSISNGNTVSLSALMSLTAVDTEVRELTSNWESVYLTVKSLSSDWEESLEIIPTVTNYLSTENVLVSSLTIIDSLSVAGGLEISSSGGSTTLYVESNKVGINTEFPNQELTVIGGISATGLLYGDGSNLTGIVAGDTEATTLVRTNSANWDQSYNIATAYSLTSSTFLTSETDSQTLSFNEGTKDLSISNGNTISLSALIDTTSIDTDVRSLTANWQTAYEQSTVYSSNSSSYVTDTTVNTLSSQLVLNSEFNNYKTDVVTATAILLPTSIYQSASGNWEDTYTTFKNVSSTFLTSETDSQTLSFDDLTKDLSISNGNTISLSALIDTTSVDTDVRSLTANWQDTYTNYSVNSSLYITTPVANANYFPLSGGIITGPTQFNNNVTIFGNLTSTGTQTFANTIFTTTSALSVVHYGEGAALWIGNNGSGDIASFYDIDQNIEVLHVGGQNSSSPNVGVKISGPNKDFTVNGEISSNNVIWDASGNSLLWNQAYNIGTAYSLTSSTFLTSETDSQTLSFNESTKDLSISNGNTVSLSALTDLVSVDAGVRSLTANWQDTFTNVQTNSANWQTAYSQGTVYSSNSSSYVTNTTLNTVSSQLVLTSDFNDYKTNVASVTATLLPTTTYQSASGNWQNTYTGYTANSSSFIKTTTTPAPGLSAVTTIVAVSAMPVSPDPNTLYIVI